MSLIKRDMQQGVAQDEDNNYRTIFHLSETAYFEKGDEVMAFVQTFNSQTNSNKGDGAELTSRIGGLFQDEIHVKVGYSQKFENELNSELN